MKKKYITVNTLNNGIHIVVATNYWKALKKAKNWFGSKSKIKVIQASIDTQSLL